MFFLVFEMFKVGIGFLLFYMMGLMVVVVKFLDIMCVSFFYFVGVKVSLYGLFVFIGVGYVIDCVMIFGFVGFLFDIYDYEQVEVVLIKIYQSYEIFFEGFGMFKFNLKDDLYFDFGFVLSGYVNGMILMVIDNQGDVIL